MSSINIVNTLLVTPDNRVIVIPNGALSNSNINNISANAVRRVDISVDVAYGNAEPEQVISGNPKILADGVVLDTEGERRDACQLHPRSAVGYSDGGNKVYFLVVDGRSTISDGVRTSVLADIMRYAGATDAMNIDGGGSSTLYTSALGVRNKPSDGKERADGNGLFAVSSAPDDSTLAELRFVDFSLVVPKDGIYTPHFYGYNKYGMLIDDDVQGVELSCSESLGTICDKCTLVATGSGTGILTGTLGDIGVSAPLTIIDSSNP